MGEITILGAGLSGLATSFHVGHEKCTIYESKPYYGGHIYSTLRDGFTWDDGPHVSFRPGEYVEKLFAESVNGQFVEGPTCVSNYFRGNWIEHPAQSNLYQVPEPLRTECVNSFLADAKEESGADKTRQLPGVVIPSIWARIRRNLSSGLHAEILDDQSGESGCRLDRRTGILSEYRRRCKWCQRAFGSTNLLGPGMALPLKRGVSVLL